jgi:hypothetical protein
VTLLWALGRNAGTCRSAAKGEAPVGGPPKGESTDAEHRGGAACRRAEGSVMGSAIQVMLAGKRCFATY